MSRAVPVAGSCKRAKIDDAPPRIQVVVAAAANDTSREFFDRYIASRTPCVVLMHGTDDGAPAAASLGTDHDAAVRHLLTTDRSMQAERRLSPSEGSGHCRGEFVRQVQMPACEFVRHHFGCSLRSDDSTDPLCTSSNDDSDGGEPLLRLLYLSTQKVVREGGRGNQKLPAVAANGCGADQPVPPVPPPVFFESPCDSLRAAGGIPNTHPPVRDCSLKRHICNLWMGSVGAAAAPSARTSESASPRGTNSGLHVDFHDNFYTLLAGCKQVMLFPPSDYKHLALAGKIHTLHPKQTLSATTLLRNQQDNAQTTVLMVSSGRQQCIGPVPSVAHNNRRHRLTMMAAAPTVTTAATTTSQTEVERRRRRRRYNLVYSIMYIVILLSSSSSLVGVHPFSISSPSPFGVFVLDFAQRRNQKHTIKRRSKTKRQPLLYSSSSSSSKAAFLNATTVNNNGNVGIVSETGPDLPRSSSQSVIQTTIDYREPKRNGYTSTSSTSLGDIMGLLSTEAVTANPTATTTNGVTTTQQQQQQQQLTYRYGITNPLDRMALTASGNLQRLVASYYDAPVQVVVDSCTLRRDSSSSTTTTTGTTTTPVQIWDRVVHLQVYDNRTFCIATSVITVYDPTCQELVASGQVGLGQLFRYLNLLPEFVLHDAAPNRDFNHNGDRGGFWRDYTLQCKELSCRIHEEFAPNMWDYTPP
jgi:Cupin-like domain